MNKIKKYAYNFMYCAALLAITFCFGGCSSEKRLNRLVKNNPNLIRVDTITKIDTTILTKYQIDTLFKSSILNDTVTITKNNIQIKYYKNNDTVYIQGKYLGDTLIKTIKVPYSTVTIEQKPVPVWYWIFLALLLGAVISLIYKNSK